MPRQIKYNDEFHTRLRQQVQKSRSKKKKRELQEPEQEPFCVEKVGEKQK